MGAPIRENHGDGLYTGVIIHAWPCRRANAAKRLAGVFIAVGQGQPRRAPPRQNL